MHIPDYMLNGRICPVTATLSAIAIGTAVIMAKKSENQPSASKFASLSALVFAAQMLNFPITHGTSGHLLGGVFLASLLGIPFGILAMAMILTIQCLVFSDGGTTVLGANILNMAVIGTAFAGLLFKGLRKALPKTQVGEISALALASWFSVIAAATACSLELIIANHLDAKQVLQSMLTAHARIGIGEMLLTTALFAVLHSHQKSMKQNSSFTAWISAFMGAVLLSPFASPLPDGLEWAAERLNLLHSHAPAFVSPLSNYSIPAVTNSIISTSLAGLAGIFLITACGWFLTKSIAPRA